MDLTNLLKGRKVKIMTDAKIEVELTIKFVNEYSKTVSVEKEKGTKENDWWGHTEYYHDVSYTIEFENGFTKTYKSLKQVDLID